MADYAARYGEVLAAGATLAAASVDPPDTSEILRRELSLPFAILCDTSRRVVQDWDIYNPRERGGIAKPAVFIIDRDRVVRYASIDTVARRVSPSEIIRVLSGIANEAARRKLYIPRLGDCLRGIRNAIRR